MSTVVSRTFDSPLGTITVAGDGTTLSHLRMVGQNHAPADQSSWRHDPDAYPEAVRQLGAYFEGDLTRFDLPVRLHGSAFQQEVWHALTEIPYGETTSYGELARRVGRPGAARAVGLANGQNPVAIIVPCHRVVGADGSLTGYAGGLHRKRILLQLEHAHDTRSPALSS
jgi:methylated-DNA-[protein]-cysteine S-methyltransferase